MEFFTANDVAPETAVPHPVTHLENTVAEFFAGIGLMRMGLERQGWTVAFANDMDPEKREIYDGHFGADDHFVLGDIHKLSAEQVPTVTLATASFPCTDLSLAGGRLGLAGAHSSALWGFTTLLEGMDGRRPPLVLLENVPGFLTSDGGQDLHAAMLRLNELGYAVDAFIIDAARFVPQSRQRLFVVGVHGLEPTFWRPPAGEARPKALLDFIRRYDDIRWRLRPLPPLPTRALSLADILDDLPPDDPHWWNDKRAAYFLNQISAGHRATAERMIADDRWSYATAFRRTRAGIPTIELRTDGVAGCLRTPKGGSARQILFKAGYGQFSVRLVTAREAARLMGADDYTLTVPLNQALFGFGDAVCVPVVSWIAENYLNSFRDNLGGDLHEDFAAPRFLEDRPAYV